MRRLIGFLAGALLAFAVGALPARAQSGAACPIGAPNLQSVTAYSLTNNDECSAIVFTASTPITVTVPNANTVAPGYQVMIFSLSGGVTLNSAVSGINGNLTSVGLGSGQSGLLYGDGANYWLMSGSGFVSGPANSVLSSLTVGRVQNTTGANSAVVTMPNGLLQFTNPASFLNGGYPFGACGAAPMTFGAGLTGQPRSLSVQTQRPWLQIFDNFSRPWVIPLCNPNP